MKSAKHPSQPGPSQQSPSKSEARATTGDIDRFAQFTAGDAFKVQKALQVPKSGSKQRDGGIRKQPNFTFTK